MSDIQTRIAFGWQVDTVKFIKFLKKNRVGSCSGYYKERDSGAFALNGKQCFCDDCWKNWQKQKGIYVLVTYPYYGCIRSETDVCVSLFHPTTQFASHEEVSKVLENKSLVEAAFETAKEFGANENQVEPVLMPKFTFLP